MIWLGNVVPDYAIKSVSLFKNKYTDYDIAFIRYTIPEIMYIYNGEFKSDIDHVLYNTIQKIFHTPEDMNIFSDYIKN
jgi:hypothetical protein